MDVFAKLKTSNQPRLGLYEDAQSEDEYDVTARLQEARKSTANYKERERKRQSILDSRSCAPADKVFLKWCSDQRRQERDEDITVLAR
jgi:hypothetical protein